LEEFVLSEGRTDEMIGHWEKGVESLRSRLLVAQGLGGHQSIAVARGSAALRQEYEEMCWNGRHARFASFVSDVFAQEDSCSNSERLAVVGDEISELEERLQELRAKQQELQMEHQETEVTVSNLAWNVTSDMLRGTFKQVAEVVDAEVQYDEGTGRSLGWAVIEFRGASDAAAAVEGFNGVGLAGRDMVVTLGMCESADRSGSEEDVI
jgi:predicted nuclease with TOPRIM domain